MSKTLFGGGGGGGGGSERGFPSSFTVTTSSILLVSLYLLEFRFSVFRHYRDFYSSILFFLCLFYSVYTFFSLYLYPFLSTSIPLTRSLFVLDKTGCWIRPLHHILRVQTAELPCCQSNALLAGLTGDLITVFAQPYSSSALKYRFTSCQQL